jgi:hypothetical protein
MPPDANPFDSDGGNLLFGTSDTSLYLFTPLQSTVLVADHRPCGQIKQAAIAGMRIIYSEIVPSGYQGDGSSGCPNFDESVDWHVSIRDIGQGSREVASGTYSISPGAGPADAAPAVAIGEVAYGFSRPDWSGTSSVVEVHLLNDDGELFQSDPFHLPVQLQLGDGRLVVASGPATADVQDGLLSVWSTTDWSRPLDPIGLTSGVVALSRDGQRLSFASCGKSDCNSLETLEPGGGWEMGLSSPASSISIDSGGASLLQATTWISTAANGTPSVRVVTGPGDHPIALAGLETPVWVHIQADVVTCLSLTSVGTLQLMQFNLRSVLQAG